MAITALFLDLDHTLTDTGGADIQAYRSTMALAQTLNLNLDASALETAYRREMGERPFDHVNGTPVTEWRRSIWHDCLKEQGVDDRKSAESLHDHFYSKRLQFFDFFPGVPRLLLQLKQNYCLVVITNGDTNIQDPKLEACQLSDYVDHIIVSGRFGIAKPDPAIFLEACRLAACQPKEAVHVGDSLSSDVQGAINAQLAATLWVSREKHSGDPRPDFQIDTFLQVPDVLQQIRLKHG